MNPELSKPILFALFAGNATSMQRKLIEEWLSDARNVEQFYEWMEEWEAHHPQFIPDAEKGLERYLACLEDPTVSTESVQKIALAPQVSLVKRWHIHWAAALVVLIGLAGFWFLQNTILYRTYQTAFGQVQTIRLGDGSTVVLNSNSVLRVPRFGFGSRTRKVYLQGEAEFSVRHTADHQRFLVHTPDKLEVEVLGTEFVVYSRQRGSKIILNKGKVQIRSLASIKTPTMPLTIVPGDVVTVDTKGSFQVQSRQPTQAYSAWKQHRFVFEDTSLQEVAYLIEENFGVSVHIPDTALANRRLTGAYQGQTANELIRVLSEMMDLKASHEGQKYILTPNE